MLKYGVIADGSLRIALEKGEIKERYWNPGDVFDEVHVLTLADDDIKPEQVQAAGPGLRTCWHCGAGPNRLLGR